MQLQPSNTHLQPVEPLTANHPIRAGLNQRGIHLHRICFRSENVHNTVQEASQRGVKPGPVLAPLGNPGQAANFLDSQDPEGVRIEVTDA